MTVINMISAVPLSVRIGWNTGPYEPNGCRLWMGHRHTRGYGEISMDGKKVTVGRAILGLCHGDGRVACHRCDNPPCCNPAHLYAGDQLDNARDRDAKGRNGFSRRAVCRNGHPFDKVNTYAHRGHRVCRACNRAAAARLKAKRDAGAR